MTTENYREVRPPARLEGYIEACWFYQRDLAEPRPDILVPEGVVDVIFNFGAPYFRQCLDDTESPGEWVSGNVLVGQRTCLFHIRWPESTRLFGVRLKAESAYCFVNGSMKNTANRTIPLQDTRLTELNRLTERLEFTGPDALVDHCFDLIGKIVAEQPPPDRRLASAVQKVRAVQGDIDMERLCASVGLHRRTLERLFATKVGITPKFFARAIRLHYFLYLHRTRSSDSLTQSLHGAKYYDQSHFIREFKAFTGETPATFFASPPDIYEPLLKSLMTMFNALHDH